ncbi:group II intron reverse transcriptase/maturase (plasmid) [Streptosporangium sp. NBC_01495]|uniref:group II intron reverse transcriptase/maturase n=1 Tax=Streptosporangium sp. NBC_01495 TaxID=2903899 RepID=UPI002E306880|nr:group II intron reverse transcriptase/maturase [Streptosporangium sp. NBC_01495]
MSEDAPVNTGATRWPDADSAFVTVRRMQTKLHRWATDDHGRRFGDLFNLVYDPAFLVHAWERVAGNVGARTPGIDRATVVWIETRIGVETFLGQIRDSLKSGEFSPVEVRQVMIPKASGKLRKLGIPTVADRVVQASLKQVLEPIFEADFLPCSYGFRPNRRAHDAIAEIHHLASEPINYRWVLEADITACFDEIDHTALMDRLRARISDKQVNALVKAFLKSGVMTADGNREETWTGTPQGGVLSPLLANIALTALDDHFDRQWRQTMSTWRRRNRRRLKGQGNWRLIRFADDFVLMVSGDRHHAESLCEEVSAVLAPLGLRLAPDKTRVVHIDEGFDFLGHHIRRQRKRGTNKYFVYTKPSRKAVQAIRDKVSAKTHRSTRNQDLARLILSLNRMLRGWANYFRHGVSKATFAAIDAHTWARLMRWIRRKYAGKARMGMPEFRRRFCDVGWRVAHQGVAFTGASTVSVKRYRYRGGNIATPWAPTPATASGG